MARRKKTSSEGSLDSLLDTLTNVVGILVIMLVVIQLGVGTAVKRIENNISETEFKTRQAELKALKELIAQLKKDKEDSADENPFINVDIAKQRKLLEAMKKKLAMIDSSVADPDKLKKQIEQHKKQIKKIEISIKKEEDEIAKLKTLLAKTPARGPDPDAKIVNLPNPQGAPKGATAEIFLCYKGRIYYVDNKRLQQKTLGKLESMKKFIVQKNRSIDCARLKEEFEKTKVQTPAVRAKITYYKTRKDPYLIVEPIAEKGEDVERITKGKSLYRQTIRRMNPRKNWIQFYVWNDSFDVYLAARNIAASRKFAAGWIPRNPTDKYTRNIEFPKEIKSQIVCAGYKAPPPRKGPAKPADPNKPKALRDDVD